MRIILLSLFIFSSFALADMTCQDLVDAIGLAFDRADTVVMEVWLEQSVFEIGYSKLQLSKHNGKWESELLEKRGAQHKKKDSDSAEPNVDFDCAVSNSKITKLPSGWKLEVIETDKTKKINNWILEYKEINNVLVPTKVVAKFVISLLGIPIYGQAVTVLSNWHIK